MASSHDWSFAGTRGTIAATTWAGDERPRHVVLIAHGYGEHVGRYGHVADALVRSGAVVHGVDHIGHGRSNGERAVVPDFEEAVDDLHTLDRTAREQSPGLPVVLLGHSMGGMIATRYAQRYGSTLAALVLSGPVVGPWESARQLLAMDEIPDLPLDPEALSRDPAVGAAYAADPLVHHGPFQREMLEAWQRCLDGIADGPGLGALPTLWVHGEDDPLVPIEGTRVGIEQLRPERLQQRSYPGARHEVFNETNGDEVIGDVVAFIDATLAT